MNHDYSKVKSFIEKVWLWSTARALFIDYCIVFTAFFLISLIVNITFALFPLVIIPVIWDCLIVITVGILIWRLTDRFLIRPEKLEKTARIIEQRIGKPHLLLSIALEFGVKPDRNAFVNETFRQASLQVDSLPVSGLYSSLSRKPIISAVTGILLWTMVTVFLRPSPVQYWDIPLNSLKRSTVSITPGTVRVQRGSNVTLSATTQNGVYPSARLTMLSKNGLQKKSLLLRADSSGKFKYTVEKVSESFSYQFSLGAQQFHAESVTVLLPPMLLGLTIDVEPPAYTGAGKYSAPSGRGDITVAAGSKLTIRMVSRELESADICLGVDTLAMNKNNDTASISLIIKEKTSYTFNLKNVHGMYNDSLPLFTIGISPDELPYVQIVKPGYDKIVQPELQETLWVEAVDDFGIRSMALQWFTSGGADRKPGTKTIAISDLQKSVRKEIPWDLREQSLYPGDTLYYWIKTRDNFPYTLHEVCSDTFAFRLPGFEEIQQSVMNKENYASDKISETKASQEKLTNRLENLLENTQGKKELTWQQEQIVNEVKKEMEAQADSLQNALESLQESVENLKKEGVLNDDISQKMDEVRKALEELIAQYGDSLLNFNKPMQNLDMDEMREAVEKAKNMLPELGEQLDNTLKFLELLKKDHELAMMAMGAEKLAQEQLSLMQEKSSPKTLERQKDLQKRIEDYLKDVKNKKMNDEKVENSMNKVDKKNKSLQSSTEQGSMPESKDMSEMSNSLMDLSEKMKSSMSSSKQKQMEELRKALLLMISQLFELSEWTNQNRSAIQSKSEQSVALSQQALNESINKVRLQLDTMKALPPVMHKGIREQFDAVYESAQQTLQSIGGSGLLHTARFLESGLQELENLLISIVESMNQNSGGKGSGGSEGDLMSQLRGLSGKQSAINSAVSELLRSMMAGNKKGPGQQQGGSENGGMSSEQAKARGDAERAQKELSKQLEELAKKFGEQEGSKGQGMSKRIDELKKEAEQIAESLKKPPTQELADRQDKFLSRMLQAVLSIHQQGEGDKEERKSEAAKQIFSKDNNKLTLDEIRKNPDAYYTMRRKAFSNNYPPEYREAIKTYFDSLGVLFLKK